MALIRGSLLRAAPGQRDGMSGKVCASCRYRRNAWQPVNVGAPGERHTLITWRVHGSLLAAATSLWACLHAAQSFLKMHLAPLIYTNKAHGSSNVTLSGNSLCNIYPGVKAMCRFHFSNSRTGAIWHLKYAEFNLSTKMLF